MHIHVHRKSSMWIRKLLKLFSAINLNVLPLSYVAGFASICRGTANKHEPFNFSNKVGMIVWEQPQTLQTIIAPMNPHLANNDVCSFERLWAKRHFGLYFKLQLRHNATEGSCRFELSALKAVWDMNSNTPCADSDHLLQWRARYM